MKKFTNPLEYYVSVFEHIMDSDLEVDYSFFRILCANIREFIFEKWEVEGEVLINEGEMIALFELTREQVFEQLLEQGLVYLSITPKGELDIQVTEEGRIRNIRLLK